MRRRSLSRNSPVSARGVLRRGEGPRRQGRLDVTPPTRSICRASTVSPMHSGDCWPGAPPHRSCARRRPSTESSSRTPLCSTASAGSGGREAGARRAPLDGRPGSSIRWRGAAAARTGQAAARAWEEAGGGARAGEAAGGGDARRDRKSVV